LCNQRSQPNQAITFTTVDEFIRPCQIFSVRCLLGTGSRKKLAA
jgi:hypothetical protein